jgi:PKD repeat protein
MKNRFLKKIFMIVSLFCTTCFFQIASAALITPPLIITPNTLPEALVGVQYNQTLSVSGGTAPYSWTVLGLPGDAQLQDGIDTSRKTITGTFSSSDPRSNTVTVTITDNNGNSLSKNFTLVISDTASPLTINTTSLPSGKQGQEYATQMIATGGAAPRTWTLTAGTVPDGVNIYDDGLIYGTPTNSGTFNFSVTVTDASNKTSTQPLTLTIAPTPVQPVTITPMTLNAEIGIETFISFEATGGAEPYTWTFDSGSDEPDGLFLEPDGFLDGTPTQAGSYQLKLVATDQNGQSATHTFDLTIASERLRGTGGSHPLCQGYVGDSFSYTVSVTGGMAPYNFSLTSGQLPNGLVLDHASGTISGTSTESGSFDLIIAVTDSAQPPDTISQLLTLNFVATVTADFQANVTSGSAPITVSFTDKSTGPVTKWEWDLDGDGKIDSDKQNPVYTYTNPGSYRITLIVIGSDGQQDDKTNYDYITVTSSSGGGGGGGGGGAGTVFTVTTSSLPNGTVGKPYSATITTSGGSSPYTWSVSGLPDGLEINVLSGVISGTPTKEGEYAVSVSVKDNDSHHASKNFDLTVNIGNQSPEVIVNQTSAPGKLFKDITGHWAEKNIERFVALGAITGYPDGTIKPDNTITRSEFATILVKAFKLEPRQGNIFNDIINHWAKDSISTTAAYGIVKGYDENIFGPDDLITREQMAAMIVRAAKLSRVSGELSFVDSADISAWARDDVFTTVEDGIIKGYPDNTFRPAGSATRAEAVTVIVNALR